MDSTTRNSGFTKYDVQKNNMGNLVNGVQMEEGTIMTSYIPSTAAPTTRSADIMTMNLSKNSTVYIKTTKEEKYLDKPAGVWNIHEDIKESDGILCLAIL